MGLNRRVDLEVSRKAQGGKQCERVRRLANQRLTGEMRDMVLAAVKAAESARIRRNEIVHHDWVLRGRDAVRPVSDLTGIAPEDLPGYLTEWERESKVSQEWQRVPSRSVDVVRAQTLDDLRQVERELSAATDVVSALTFKVASVRETGSPPGYLQ